MSLFRLTTSVGVAIVLLAITQHSVHISAYKLSATGSDTSTNTAPTASSTASTSVAKPSTPDKSASEVEPPTPAPAKKHPQSTADDPIAEKRKQREETAKNKSFTAEELEQQKKNAEAAEKEKADAIDKVKAEKDKADAAQKSDRNTSCTLFLVCTGIAILIGLVSGLT